MLLENTHSIKLEHTVIMLSNIEIHKVHLASFIKKCELDDLYQTFDILQPDDVIQSHFSRKLDYFMGRLAGRFALKKYNLASFNIVKGEYGEPIFPEHIQGRAE